MCRNAVAVAALCYFLAGCVYVDGNLGNEGTLAVAARFPAGRIVAVIPDNTSRIEVRVTGAGIPENAVLSASLTPERSGYRFQTVPAGPKTVNVKAFGATDELLATGTSQVLIVAGATVAARIRLDPVADMGNFSLVLE